MTLKKLSLFVFGYDDRFPEVVFEPIRSKEEDLRNERTWERSTVDNKMMKTKFFRILKLIQIDLFI